MFRNNANERERWPRKSDCVTLGMFLDDILSRSRRETVYSPSAFCTWSAFCTQPTVCSLHFELTDWSSLCDNTDSIFSPGAISCFVCISTIRTLL